MRQLAIMLTATLASATPAWAEGDARATAKAFGVREAVSQISLSPDGRHVAMVNPRGDRGSTVSVVELIKDAEPHVVLASNGIAETINSCRWSSDTRLICEIKVVLDDAGDRYGFTRMVALDQDGGNLKLLSAPSSSRALGVAQAGGRVIDWTAKDGSGAALMTRVFVPEDTRDSHVARTARGLGVERVDTTTLKRQTVEPPRPTAVEYITDGHGEVRVMGLQPNTNIGYEGSRINYLYRKSGEQEWHSLGKLSIEPGRFNGFHPGAVDRDLNVVYGFDDKDGRRALYRVSLSDGLQRELVLARPDVDVDQFESIGRQNRVVGASYATERRQTEFFDPELRRLRVALGKALPGAPLVTFLDASADESRLLLFAGSDNDAGRYYLYTKATRQLAEVAPVRPDLAGLKLANVTPVSFPAADGTVIPGYLTLPADGPRRNLPTIVLPHGGPGARDEWGFDWLSQFFAARGYAVFQPNFRGSSGYGSAWFQKNGFQSWKMAIGDVDDAGRWLLEQGIAAPGKLAIVGWSYGGYAALQSGVVDPDLYKAIVAIAPVTDLETLRQESRNYSSFALVDSYIGRGAHIREGSPARNAARIKAPVLLFHGTVDDNVDIGESRMMADRLKDAGKHVELVEFKGLDHQLEDSSARAQMLEKSDVFLRHALGL